MATLPDNARQAAITAVAQLMDAGTGAGYFELQTSGSVEVATLTASDPAFASYTNGVATASAITDDSSATGGDITNGFLEAYDSDNNVCFTLTAGPTGSGREALFSGTSGGVIGAGAVVSISSLTLTQPAS